MRDDNEGLIEYGTKIETSGWIEGYAEIDSTDRLAVLPKF
jgi:hypothetical protein